MTDQATRKKALETQTHAYNYAQGDFYQDAYDAYQEAIHDWNRLEVQTAEDMSHLAECYAQSGRMCLILKNWEQAIHAYDAAINQITLCEPSAENNNKVNVYHNEIATAYGKWGNGFFKLQQWEFAKKAYLAAVNQLKEINTSEMLEPTEKYQIDKNVSYCYSRLGHIHLASGSIMDAKQYFLSAIRRLTNIPAKHYIHDDKRNILFCLCQMISIYITQNKIERINEYLPKVRNAWGKFRVKSEYKDAVISTVKLLGEPYRLENDITMPSAGASTENITVDSPDHPNKKRGRDEAHDNDSREDRRLPPSMR